MSLMHTALMKRSGWTYRKRLRDLFAARWWGCPTPAAFDALPRDDRLDILAAYEAHWRIEAVNAHEIAKPKG